MKRSASALGAAQASGAGAPDSQLAVQGTGIHKWFGHVHVLDDVCFEVANSEVVVIIGPSGSGKTTLMRTIVGVQLPTAGTVKVLGATAGTKLLRSAVGYVTQSPSVYPDLTVLENLRFFAAIAGAKKDRVLEVINDVHLAPRAHQLVARLSGGERARVSLAVALLGQPKLLVLDEPTVGLDPVLRAELWQQFHDLAAAGTTLLVSSHVMDEAHRCDRLILVRDGRVLAADTPAALMQSTHTKDVESAFLKLVGAK